MYTEVLVLVKQRTGQYLDGYKVTEIIFSKDNF